MRVLGKQRLDPPGNRCGHLAVQLLVDNRLQQSFKYALHSLGPQRERARLDDNARQLAIHARQVRKGFGVIEFLCH